MSSSNASAPCRFEWRPSRWVTGALSALTVLAPCAVLWSEMPRGAAWPLAMTALLIGLWSNWREARRPACAIVLDGAGAASVDGAVVEGFRVVWRGPLAFLSWRDPSGRTQRRSLWPDTLPPALRRELRLAAGRNDAVRRTGPMAP